MNIWGPGLIVYMFFSDGDIWAGVWTIPKRDRAYDYKYFIHGGEESSNADTFEWIGKTGGLHSQIVNRCLNLSGQLETCTCNLPWVGCYIFFNI